MSGGLRLRATLADHRSVRRVLELAPAHTLADLQAALVEELALDPDDPWVYFLSGERLDASSEFARDGGVWGRRGREVRVEELGLADGDHLSFFSGFTDERRVDLDVLERGVEVPPDLARPRVVVREGEPPRRRKPKLEEELDPSDPLAPRAAGEDPRSTRSAGGEGQGEGGPPEPAASPPPPTREESAALRALAAKGDAERAIPLAREHAARLGQREPLVQVALALAEAGMLDDARRALESAEAVDAPVTQRLRLVTAQVRLLLGDAPGAEAELRRVVSSRWPSPKIRPLAARALAGVLNATGRADEAAAVVATERLRAEADAGVVRRAAPKVGRNDPCPCGSGRKAKRCCGA